jgi:cilia- and flagella-associated protein 57
LNWSKDDSILLSAGLDGAVYSWKTGEVGEGGNRTDYISPEKGCQMNSAIYNSELKIIYATGTDMKIKVLDEEKETSFTKTDAVLNCLAMTNSAKILFAGISDEKYGGLIRSYKLPLGSNCTDYLAHDGSGIENIAITFDDQYLITAGRDGCLMIFEIKDKEARAMKNKDGYTKYADEIFMTKKDLDDLKQQKEQQRNNKREAQNAGNQFSLTGKDDIIKQRREIQKTVMEAEAAKYATLENNIKEKQQDHIKQLEGFQKTYEDELQEIENTYQRKTREEVASYEGYKRIQEEKREEYREKITALINEHNESIKGLEERYSREIDAENREFNKARGEKEELEREHREIMEQIKSETEQEIKDLESKFITENNLLQDAALKIKSEVSVNNKKIASLELDAAELDDKLTEYKEQKKKLEDQRNELRDDIKNYKREIDERDRIITEKEKRIYELKKRAQELEKFKFVLDYKIKELRRDIGPRDLQIQEMKKETNIMDNVSPFPPNNPLEPQEAQLDQQHPRSHRRRTR